MDTLPFKGRRWTRSHLRPWVQHLAAAAHALAAHVAGPRAVRRAELVQRVPPPARPPRPRRLRLVAGAAGAGGGAHGAGGDEARVAEAAAVEVARAAAAQRAGGGRGGGSQEGLDSSRGGLSKPSECSHRVRNDGSRRRSLQLFFEIRRGSATGPLFVPY
jgi:hypothetical protein